MAGLQSDLSHDLHISIHTTSLPTHQKHAAIPDKQRLNDEIAATDAHIDRLVYELYGLTDEEIRIVEGEEG